LEKLAGCRPNKQALNKNSHRIDPDAESGANIQGTEIAPAFQNGKVEVIDDLNGDSLLCPKLL
jgi:hypothetical protein